jgi:ATP-dependent helicase/nuclease subunit A
VVTPTTLMEGPVPVRHRYSDGGHDRDVSRLVGTLAHRLLERWDFAAPAANLLDEIAPNVRRMLTADQDEFYPTIIESLRELFTTWGQSDSYARLRSAEILGREVPFLIPWGEHQVMEGVIDIIYRLDGHLWIADYKTDQVTAEEAPARAERYSQQAMLYRQAAAACLGTSSVSFQFLFLRPAVSVVV